MKRLTTLFLSAIAAVLLGCDEQDVQPVPEKKIRAEKVQHGNYHYRMLTYNDQGKVTRITTGLIAEEDTAIVEYEVVYAGGQVNRIHIQNGWEIKYIYDGTFIVESQEYIAGVLQQINRYQYDAGNQLISWVALRDPEGKGFEPIVKHEYAYNGQGNLVEDKIYFFDASTKLYTLTSTMTYEDFDDKRSSGHLFWTNLYNLTHRPFQNNPRVWRVVNGNGSVGEERVRYEYNDFGYATHQISETGGYPIEYIFSEN